MRVLIISDAHANIHPLKYVIQREKFDKIVFCGDAVDYGPNPGETLDLLKENADVMVSGNHDYAAAYSVDCRCGEENHELSVFTRENITLKKLGKNDISFLRSLPNRMDMEIDGMKFQVMHGSPRDELYGYMYPWSVQDHLRSMLGSPLDPANYVVGHTHYQFLIRYAGNLVINPGSIGQPRDNPMPSYAVYDSSRNSVEFPRFDYDRSKLKEDIRSIISDQEILSGLYRLFSL
ncbi:metallophosphoesterase family protein [Thermoplasma acidophilum]|uniref:metallophosphoesterase family protein n=1 Tax=Thermoplasma acidophilum TaxID=2303 RepID=UPI00064E8886|nr:metallophosphoesterase family protein [Thermoplasma acidophilum]